MTEGINVYVVLRTSSTLHYIRKDAWGLHTICGQLVAHNDYWDFQPEISKHRVCKTCARLEAAR